MGLFDSSVSFQQVPGSRFGLKRLKSLVQLMQAFGMGAPGSAPWEEAELAQTNAGVGQAFGGQMNNLLAAMNPGGTMGGSAADAMARLQGSEGAARVAARAGLMNQFGQQRQNVLFKDYPSILNSYLSENNQNQIGIQTPSIFSALSGLAGQAGMMAAGGGGGMDWGALLGAMNRSGMASPGTQQSMFGPGSGFSPDQGVDFEGLEG